MREHEWRELVLRTHWAVHGPESVVDETTPEAQRPQTGILDATARPPLRLVGSDA